GGLGLSVVGVGRGFGVGRIRVLRGRALVRRFGAVRGLVLGLLALLAVLGRGAVVLTVHRAISDMAASDIARRRSGGGIPGLSGEAGVDGFGRSGLRGRRLFRRRGRGVL